MFKNFKRKIKRSYHYLVTKFFLKRQLRKQFSNSSLLDNVKIDRKKVLVAMVELNHYQFLQVLSLAKALELRGAEIKVLICDESLHGCEIKSVDNESDNDPCWECRFNKKNIFPNFEFESITYGDLISEKDLIKIEEQSEDFLYKENIIFNNIDLTTYINDSVTRYYYGSKPDEKNNELKTKYKHIRTALINSIFAERIDDAWSPDIVLCNMAVYSIWGPIYHHFKDRVSMISISNFEKKSIYYNFPDVSNTRDRFHQYKEQRENRKLNSLEKEEIAKFYYTRYSGNDWLHKKNSFYDNSISNQSVKSQLSIDSRKRNIFLFSNLFWDVGLADQARLYNDVISWVLHTIDLLKNNDSVHLYIKTHPIEEFSNTKSRKTVASIIEDKYPDGLGNVTVIKPQLKIKPYLLFPFIDIATLYQGTLGFELLDQNIPIISCGSAAYNRLGLVHEPENTFEYLDLLLNGKGINYDRDLFDLLSYFYFKKVSIPWDISNISYGNSFIKPFNIDKVDDLLSKKSTIDHLCKVIFANGAISPETWEA